MKEKPHPIINMSLYGKFITAFVIIIIISIALAVVGITNINRQVIYGGNILEYSARPNDYVAHMSLAYNKILSSIRNASLSTNTTDFDNYIKTLEINEKVLSDNLYLYSLTIEGAADANYATYLELARKTAANPDVTVEISTNTTTSATTAASAVGEASAEIEKAAEKQTDNQSESIISPIIKADAVSGATTAAQKFTAIDNIKNVAVESHKALAKIRMYIESGDQQGAIGVLNDEIHLCSEKMDYALNLMLTLSDEDALSLQNQMNMAQVSSISVMSVALAMSIIGAIIIASFMTHIIIRPIKLVTKRASRVAAGYFDTDVSLYGNDEIGWLSRSVNDVSKTYAKLTNEMSNLVERHEAGEIEYRIDENKFEAAYQDVIKKMNHMVGSYTETLFQVLTCVEGIAKGDFDAPLPQYPNQKAIANKMVDSLRSGLKNTSVTIGGLVESVKNGDLNQRADLDGFYGDWRNIAEGLNRMMDEIAAPISEATTVLNSFSKGDLNVKIEGSFNGSFSLIKTSINDTLTAISSYVKEISQMLTSITNNDLNVSITRDYVGDFIQMKDAINLIATKFNIVLKEIDVAADQVSIGAKMISDSAISLADSAKIQTDSVMKLDVIMDGIKDKTTKSAQDAQDAERLSDQSRESAQLGNKDMLNMLKSMEGIKESSDNISRIIKVIDDIAFQTNLLALNAAVEAARAGVHGKGFAVVAEEVRNLASRSQKAALETTALIEESINKVDDGTRIAKLTSNALENIVSNVTKVSEIISRITKASNEQASDIANVSSELSAISSIVQSTSGAAENSASASQQLLGQSDTLKGMTSVFKLK